MYTGKIARLCCLVLMLGAAKLASATVISTLVDEAGSPTSEGLSKYLQPVEWSAYIDPMQTNWIGLHNTDAPTTDSRLPGREYIGGTPFVNWIGLVNDYLTLTITNTDTGASMTRIMDYNDGGGNESGIQSVIFGTAAIAPDVHRLQNPFSTRNWVTYDEPGAFNALFTSAATYEFRMTYGNTGGGSFSQDHVDIFFLADVEAVPAPDTMVLFLLGLAGVVAGGIRRRKI